MTGYSSMQSPHGFTYNEKNMKSIVNIQSKADLFGNEDNTKKAREVFGKFLYEGELGVLFGDSNTGKSILANDIAFFVSGGGHSWQDMVSPNIPSLYFDLEMTTKQFASRYHTAEPYIPDGYHRAMLDASKFNAEDIFPAIRTQIVAMQNLQDSPKFIVIDNITNGFGSILNATKMRKLICDFKLLKERFNLTILLIAHCPKRKKNKPITQDDLGGSKMIINFVDSAFAIAPSFAGENIKYIKQIKTRESEKMSKVMTVKITDEPFLRFDYRGYNDEDEHITEKTTSLILDNLTPEQEALLARLLLDNELSYNEISDTVGITKEAVIDYVIFNKIK